MPNHRTHAKVRTAKDDVSNNNENVPALASLGKQVVHDNARIPPGMARCSIPSGCFDINLLIDLALPDKAVKVICNNDQCTMGSWMHDVCFEAWESSVLNYLRSCGRARSWSEKQRLQNLWTKKGYDLAFKACDCKCGRGHLRKDLDYFKPVLENKMKKKPKKKNDKPTPVIVSHGHNNNNHSHNANQNHHFIEAAVTNDNAVNNITRYQNMASVTNDNNGNEHSTIVPSSNIICHSVPMSLRLRAGSFSSSTGSSPPTSAGSDSPIHMSPLVSGQQKANGFDFFCEGQTNTSSIFKHRADMSAFSSLPRHKQNSYHIKMEDEGPYGNDDTRCFVLTNLSSYKVTSIECVLCKVELPVFDRYPLIDGTFFLSRQPYSGGVIQLVTDNKIQYLNAVCVNCLEGYTDVRCYACKSKWDGRALQIGTMYSYDIFAAMPCCQKRLTCKSCHRAVVDIMIGLPFYSEYSCSIECPYCKVKDTHFIRPLSETFHVKPASSIWKC